MAGRKRRRVKRKRKAGCLTVLVLTAAFAAGAAYAVPWIANRLGDEVTETFGETVENAVNTLYTAGVNFPEISGMEEEAAEHFYYQQLTEAEQTVYLELLQGVNEMEACISVHAGKDDHPEKIYEYLLYDCPELFWCVGSSQMTVYDSYTQFYPVYACSEEEKTSRQAEIDEAVSECAAGITPEAGEYDRICYVYEYLVNTVDYDENAPDNQNIYSALVGKSSVCAGYSRAAQYLLNRMGIECIYVVGTAQGQEAHAWNIVKCSGKYYQMDVTFADPVFMSAESGDNLPDNIIYYDYLCCTDEEISADHMQSREVPYPACTSDDLDYYRMNGMYYESFDPQILLSAMNDSIYAKKEMFVCKFADARLYSRAREKLTGDLFPKAAQTLASVYGLERVSYSYVEDETHNKMIVFWNYQQ